MKNAKNLKSQKRTTKAEEYFESIEDLAPSDEQIRDLRKNNHKNVITSCCQEFLK